MNCKKEKLKNLKTFTEKNYVKFILLCITDYLPSLSVCVFMRVSFPSHSFWPDASGREGETAG